MSLEHHESVDFLKQSFKKKLKSNLRIIFVLLILQLMSILVLIYMTKPYEAYVFSKCIEGKFRSAISTKKMIRNQVIFFKKPDGSMVKVKIHVMLNNEGVITTYDETKKNLTLLFMMTLPIFFLRKPFLEKIATLSSKTYGDKYIRGARLIDCKEYTKIIKNDVSDLMLSNIPISKKAKNRHYIFLGKTGAGKSQSCMQLVDPDIS